MRGACAGHAIAPAGTLPGPWGHPHVSPGHHTFCACAQVRRWADLSSKAWETLGVRHARAEAVETKRRCLYALQAHTLRARLSRLNGERIAQMDEAGVAMRAAAEAEAAALARAAEAEAEAEAAAEAKAEAEAEASRRVVVSELARAEAEAAAMAVEAAERVAAAAAAARETAEAEAVAVAAADAARAAQLAARIDAAEATALAAATAAKEQGAKAVATAAAAAVATNELVASPAAKEAVAEAVALAPPLDHFIDRAVLLAEREESASLRTELNRMRANLSSVAEREEALRLQLHRLEEARRAETSQHAALLQRQVIDVDRLEAQIRTQLARDAASDGFAHAGASADAAHAASADADAAEPAASAREEPSSSLAERMRAVEEEESKLWAQLHEGSSAEAAVNAEAARRAEEALVTVRDRPGGALACPYTTQKSPCPHGHRPNGRRL